MGTWSGLTSTFTPDNTYVKDGQLVLRAKKTNAEEPQTGGDSDDDEASDDDNDNDSDDGSDDGSDGEDLKEGSEDDNDSDDDKSDSDEGKESDDDKDSGDDSHEESSEEPDFHVLPSPKSGTLDSAIEKTSRVLVSLVRTELQNFSQSMS